MAQHPYYETGTVASSAAFESVAYIYRLRSLFDPNFTGTGKYTLLILRISGFVRAAALTNLLRAGHQPRGRDQIVGMGYNYYKVHGVALDIKMTYNTTESDYPTNLFAVYLSGATDPFIDPEALEELGQCSECVLLAKKWMSSNNSGQNNVLNDTQLLHKSYQGNLFQKATR